MASDYSDIGLNEYLQSVSSPVVPPVFRDAYNFQASLDRGAIATRHIENLAVTNAKIQALSADKMTAGTITVAVNLGTSASGSVILDGANNRIVVNDGTTNRIVIGNV